MSRLNACIDPLLRRGRAAVGRLARLTDGATAIEYALIAGTISITILVGVTAIGSDLTNFFVGTSKQMQSKTPR